MASTSGLGTAFLVLPIVKDTFNVLKLNTIPAVKIGEISTSEAGTVFLRLL